MPSITYIENSGTKHSVDVSAGTSVMEGAVDNNIPGIDGDCGGECACATCHVYVDPEWAEQVGGPDEQEAGMLSIADNTQPNSRLGCQIKITDCLDGLVVWLPEGQH